jgi:hypothetical protein
MPRVIFKMARNAIVAHQARKGRSLPGPALSWFASEAIQAVALSGAT